MELSGADLYNVAQTIMGEDSAAGGLCSCAVSSTSLICVGHNLNFRTRSRRSSGARGAQCAPAGSWLIARFRAQANGPAEAVNRTPHPFRIRNRRKRSAGAR